MPCNSSEFTATIPDSAVRSYGEYRVSEAPATKFSLVKQANISTLSDTDEATQPNIVVKPAMALQIPTVFAILDVLLLYKNFCRVKTKFGQKVKVSNTHSAPLSFTQIARPLARTPTHPCP